MSRREPKAYVMVRPGLCPGQVLAQAVHAAMKLAVASPAAADLPLVVVSAPTAESFERAQRALALEEIEPVQWREPDRQDELTAVAFVGVKPRATASMPLALQLR